MANTDPFEYAIRYTNPKGETKTTVGMPREQRDQHFDVIPTACNPIKLVRPKPTPPEWVEEA